MKFTPLPLDGACLISAPTHTDVRGSYRSTFNRDEFEKHGLIGTFVESGIATNLAKGTIRGLHYQKAPHAQAKLVRCVAGTLFDVIVDLRPDSLTYLQHCGVWLMADKPTLLYVPKGFAHGYQTQTDGCVVEYHMSDIHKPAFAHGIRYDDPAFGIQWPLNVAVLLERDASYPDYKPLHDHIN